MNEPLEMFFSDRNQWRKWLEMNHDKIDQLWVIYYKKNSGKKSLAYNEAVEEALCFGWIDSQIKSIDPFMYKQKYTPRRKNSLWSDVNRKRVEKMINEGKMTAAGLKRVDEAKKNGQWEKAYGKMIVHEIPEDLLKALSENEEALANFLKFAPSHRNTYIHWLNHAKREETRLKRIDKIIQFAEMNKKPGIT